MRKIFCLLLFLAAIFVMPIRGAPNEESGMLFSNSEVDQMVGSFDIQNIAAVIVRVESGGGVLAQKCDVIVNSIMPETVGFESGGGVRAEETV